jgi:nucleotide-binding universal stress UspA family protein
MWTAEAATELAREARMDQLTPFRRAILATDGSTEAQAVVTFAGALAWQPETRISVASIVEVQPPSELAIDRMAARGLSGWRRVLELSHTAARDQASRFVADAAASLRERHPTAIINEVVGMGEPAAELLSLATNEQAQLILVGARGRTELQTLLLGSVSEALLPEAPCPVLVVRRPVADLSTVLVAVRTSEDADGLAEICLRLPLPATTRLVAVSVSTPQAFVKPGHQPFAPGRVEAMLDEWAAGDDLEAEAAGERYVDRIRAAAPDRAVAARVVRGQVSPSLVEARADVAPTLMAEAEGLDASLIVVSARERHGPSARLGLGSVSRKIVRRAPTAVLVVRDAPVGSQSLRTHRDTTSDEHSVAAADGR